MYFWINLSWNWLKLILSVSFFKSILFFECKEVDFSCYCTRLAEFIQLTCHKRNQISMTNFHKNFNLISIKVFEISFKKKVKWRESNQFRLELIKNNYKKSNQMTNLPKNLNLISIKMFVISWRHSELFNQLIINLIAIKVFKISLLLLEMRLMKEERECHLDIEKGFSGLSALHRSSHLSHFEHLLSISDCLFLYVQPLL